jgi:hypothetical protein
VFCGSLKRRVITGQHKPQVKANRARENDMLLRAIDRPDRRDRHA